MKSVPGFRSRKASRLPGGLYCKRNREQEERNLAWRGNRCNANGSDWPPGKTNRMALTETVTESAMARTGRMGSQSNSPPTDSADDEAENFQIELLPVEDIYPAAGVRNPPRGYR